MATEEKEHFKPTFVVKFVKFLTDCMEKPVIWFRESIVLPNRKEYYYYHEKRRRVPTIDECFEDDAVCRYEADRQYEHDRDVEMEIVNILRKRFFRCAFENRDFLEECQYLKEKFERARVNYFIKYGDLPFFAKSLECYMKQKHRMAWERRHGPVGSGRKSERPEETEEYDEE